MTDMSRFSRSGRGPGPACRGRRGRHVACNPGPDDEVATMRARAAGDGGCGLWRRHARLEREGGGTAGTAGQSGSGGAAGGQATVSEADAERVRAETRCRLLFECCDPAGRLRRGRFAGLRIRHRRRLRRSLSSVLPGRARRSPHGRAHLRSRMPRLRGSGRTGVWLRPGSVPGMVRHQRHLSWRRCGRWRVHQQHRGLLLRLPEGPDVRRGRILQRCVPAFLRVQDGPSGSTSRSR